MGGFVGQCGTMSVTSDTPPISDREVVLQNCYSTSMVGMNYDGNQIGGFAGLYNYGILSNCYAAGETGSIDTDVRSVSLTHGGFFGNYQYSSSITSCTGFSNCYYDMQTTAMKNKAVGNAAPLAMTRDADGVSTALWNGIKGLTTKKMTGASNLFSSGFVYMPGLYPQISSLANHSDLTFRAQSAASAATVFCDDWSDLSATGFDTVRDTIRNYAFSSTESFGSNVGFSAAQVVSPNISDIRWAKDGNTSPIDRATPVIELSEQPYYTTALSPGIEWAEVSLTYTDGTRAATGNRRLRLIPTSRISVGSDQRIDVYQEGDEHETQPYDHKEGFAATHLDASVLQSYLASNAAHPESLVAFDKISPQTCENSIISGELPLAFNPKTKCLAVTASMTDAKGNPASISNLYEKLNGTTSFEPQDFGTYLIAYKASLVDGRYLSGSKKLVVVSPYSVVYNYNYTGLLNGELVSPDSIFDVQQNLKDFDGYVFAPFSSPPTRDGWNFAYWSLDKEGKSPVSQRWFDSYADKYGALDRNIDVYAQYNRLSPSAETTLVIDPTTGSYGEKPTGEKTVLSGSSGDRVAIDPAFPPNKFLFESWAANELGGGTLEKSDETESWIFTFGDDDAKISAKYMRNVFDCDIHWINKFTGQDIIEPVHYDLGSGDSFSFDSHAVDAERYNVPAAAVEVLDADTGEALPLEEANVAIGENGKGTGMQPGRNITINIVYDTWIQMPATGQAGLAGLVGLGTALVLVFGIIRILYRRRTPRTSDGN